MCLKAMATLNAETEFQIKSGAGVLGAWPRFKQKHFDVEAGR